MGSWTLPERFGRGIVQRVFDLPCASIHGLVVFITVKEGESSVVTGLLTRADSLSLSGYPFLSTVPGVTYAASQHNTNGMDDELMVVITPHLVRMPEKSSFAVALPSGQ